LIQMKKTILTALLALASVSLTLSDAAARNVVAMAAVSGAPSTAQPLGRFEVFASDSDSTGGIFHTWQLADKSGWQQSWVRYTPVPDKKPRGLVAGRDRVGRIVVAWLSDGGINFAQSIHVDASLLSTAAMRIPSAIDPNDSRDYRFKALAIATYTNGPVEIFALSDRGRVWSTRQRTTSDDGQPWIGATRRPNGTRDSHLALIGGGDLQQIAVANVGDQLALVGVGNDGKVYVKRQSSAEFWETNDTWNNLGGNEVQEVRAHESKDHQLEIVALGKDHRLYLNYENVGVHTFVGWQVLGPSATEKYANAFFLDHFKDGTLFVTTHFDLEDGSQWKGTFGTAFQGPNNGGWTGKVRRVLASTSPSPDSTATNSQDDLGYLSAQAFTLARDANGDINYFAAYRGGVPRVEHYVDKNGVSGDGRIFFQAGQGQGQYGMPTLP
jgi:hypothetical protein